MSRYRVDPRAVTSVEMKDGTSYPVSKAGYVEVTRADHAREMEKGTKQFRDRGAASVERIALFGVGLGKTCAGCGFEGWPWQKVCPRCHARL